MQELQMYPHRFCKWHIDAVFLGSLLCIPVQGHCVTVWCNPSMNASSQRRMSEREWWWWKLCQWFTWLLCRFTSCTLPTFTVSGVSQSVFLGGFDYVYTVLTVMYPCVCWEQPILFHFQSHLIWLGLVWIYYLFRLNSRRSSRSWTETT